MASETRIESGIDISTTKVERHEPRNSRIISPVSPAAMAPSRSTSLIAPDTNTDWSNKRRDLQVRRRGRADAGQQGSSPC